MWKLSKKIMIGILIINIIIIIMLLLYFSNNSSNILFKSSFVNDTMGYTDYGYIIYRNGVIQEYHDSENLKKDKITKEELSQLKDLANKVEDKYKIDERYIQGIADAGRREKVIYSNKLSKFVVLSRSGNEYGINSTETSREILNLTEKLYNKYLINENK